MKEVKSIRQMIPKKNGRDTEGCFPSGFVTHSYLIIIREPVNQSINNFR
jgi:hypothetical protein